jgi:hypothetical protein
MDKPLKPPFLIFPTIAGFAFLRIVFFSFTGTSLVGA